MWYLSCFKDTVDIRESPLFWKNGDYDICIVWTLPFLKGGVKFWLPPPDGGKYELKKGGGTIVERQAFLKGGWGEWGWYFSNLIFSRFIIFTFRNYFSLCKIVLCIWRKIIFFCHHNFMKKGHSKLSKNEPENIL